MKRCSINNFTMGLCIAIAIMVVAVRAYVARKSRQSRPGSVADLVRRGQLRSDRRGMYDFVLWYLFLCLLVASANDVNFMNILH